MIYEVTIRATLTKTLTIETESDSREAAIEEANERFNIGYEFDEPEDYEQDLVSVRVKQ